MIRILCGAACVLFALTLAVGCGNQAGGGGQPRLANPNDPKVKDLAPTPIGGGPKGNAGEAKPF
jgi:hypothetical protein